MLFAAGALVSARTLTARTVCYVRIIMPGIRQVLPRRRRLPRGRAKGFRRPRDHLQQLRLAPRPRLLRGTPYRDQRAALNQLAERQLRQGSPDNDAHSGRVHSAAGHGQRRRQLRGDVGSVALRHEELDLWSDAVQ